MRKEESRGLCCAPDVYCSFHRGCRIILNWKLTLTQPSPCAAAVAVRGRIQPASGHYTRAPSLDSATRVCGQRQQCYLSAPTSCCTGSPFLEEPLVAAVAACPRHNEALTTRPRPRCHDAVVTTRPRPRCHDEAVSPTCRRTLISVTRCWSVTAFSPNRIGEYDTYCRTYWCIPIHVRSASPSHEANVIVLGQRSDREETGQGVLRQHDW